jgi:hypothetical protein
VKNSSGGGGVFADRRVRLECQKSPVRKIAVFASALILILLLPMTLLPSILESLFSANELTEMGIRLEPGQAEDPLQPV